LFGVDYVISSLMAVFPVLVITALVLSAPFFMLWRMEKKKGDKKNERH